MVKVFEGTQCYFRGVPDVLVCFIFIFCFYVSISLVNCKLAEMSILLLYMYKCSFSVVN